MASFLDLFNATIGTITAAKNELIEIKSSVTVHDALQLMIAQQVTVLPIYQPPSGIDEPAAAFVSQGKEYLGMVTLNDIITFIINVYLNEAERIDDCFRTSVYQIIGSSNESAIDRSLVIESEATPLSDLIDKFCQGSPSQLNEILTDPSSLSRCSSLHCLQRSGSQSLCSKAPHTDRCCEISLGSN
jgi:hypothetical protein